VVTSVVVCVIVCLVSVGVVMMEVILVLWVCVIGSTDVPERFVIVL